MGEAAQYQRSVVCQRHHPEKASVVKPADLQRTAQPARFDPGSLTDLLLLSCAAAALLVALLRGSEVMGPAFGILLAVVAARLGGVRALIIATPAALLPLHLITRSALQWDGLLWDLLAALAIGGLVAELSGRLRRSEREQAAALRVRSDLLAAIRALRVRIARQRALAQHSGRTRSLQILQEARFLALTPLELISEAHYPSVYQRIADSALGMLGDASRIDLWEVDGRPLERFWSAAREPRAELNAFLNDPRAVDRLLDVRKSFQLRRAQLIQPQPGQGLPLLIVPILVAGQVRATLTVCRVSGREYDAHSMSLADSFARRCAIVIVHLFRLEHMMTARHRAELGEQEKADALAAFSHDMRTPLQAVNGYTQLLLEEIAGRLTPKQREYLNRMQQAQAMATGFVDRVLAQARLDSVQHVHEMTNVELGAVAREVAAMFTVDCQRKNLTLELPSSQNQILVRADREKVWRVLQNLISNAVKYTPAGGIVSLSWRKVVDQIFVLVSDSGRGVASGELEAIFRPFYQVDPQSEGSGLGLAISRNLARDMGGDLLVASELGRGSTFTLRLPNAEPARERAAVRLEPLVIPALATRSA